MFLYPGSLARQTLVDPRHTSRAPGVPGMVSPLAIRALVCDLLLGLVLGEAVLSIVSTAADAAHYRECARSLVVTVLLAPEAAKRLWGVRPEVVGSPVP